MVPRPNREQLQRKHLHKGGSMRRYFSLLSPLALLMAACATTSDEGARLVTVDHYVRVKSTAPAFAGREVTIYVREVVLAGPAFRTPPPAAVVLFVPAPA